MGRTGRTGDYAIVPSHSSRFHRGDSEDDAETDGDDDRDGEPRRIDSSKHAGVPQRENCASQQGEVADQVEMNEFHAEQFGIRNLEFGIRIRNRASG